jgi:hypothetical protein
MQRFRKYIFTLLFFSLIASFILGQILGPSVADTFAATSFFQRYNPLWIGVAATIALIVMAIFLWLAFWRSAPFVPAKPTLQQQGPVGLPALPSQIIAFILVFGALNCLTFLLLATEVEKLVVKSSAKTDVFYAETVRPIYRRGCANAVTWPDPIVRGNVTACLSAPLFPKYSGPTNQQAIVHALRGPSGIRVLTVHALNSQLGQEDLAAMRTTQINQSTGE